MIESEQNLEYVQKTDPRQATIHEREAVVSLREGLLKQYPDDPELQEIVKKQQQRSEAS